MELWDLYNEKREKTGTDHVRGEKIPDGFYHLVVHVWIRNKKGEYLISQRSESRKQFPLMWECVGGSVLKGEDSLHGAIREAEEEVGAKLCPKKGKVMYSVVGRVIGGVKFTDIVDAWVFTTDEEIDLKNATTDEVKQFRWLNLKQIKALFDAGEMVHTLEYFFTEIDSGENDVLQ